MIKTFFLSKTQFDFSGKKVLLRIDCDVDLKEEMGKLVVDEDFRLKQAIPTIELLRNRGAEKIIMLGHLGRPEGTVREEMRLRPVAEELNELLKTNLKFEILNFKSIFNNSNLNFQTIYQFGGDTYLMENLRFNKGEEENDEGFAKELAGLGDMFVNDAFGVSHRKHASIVGVPKFLPSFLGLNFEKEVKVLSGLKEKAQRPLVFVLGGSKKDKLGFIEFLIGWCDSVLIGGKLPKELKTQNSKLKTTSQNSKLFSAELNLSGKDLSEKDIQIFKQEIQKAKTVVWAGPMGVYEEKENQRGTFEIAGAVTEVNGFKVAGGGDTHRIISWLDLWEKFDFVSSGGGAMLAFLKNGTLPGIEAIK